MPLHPDHKGPVILVDTPGFDATYRSDIECLSLIADDFIKIHGERTPLSEIVPRQVSERWDTALRTTSQEDMSVQGCRAQAFLDSCDDAWERIGTLPTTREKSLSNEIIEDKKGLNETAAAIELNAIMQKLITD
ncbi:hypothetical protein FIBSPDRAFT_944592 [Athelia psychrophila]|uniref:G domain-containing protein n=1 Tax=Athelia psychrophila TaxID=1759441 RepID=A0A166UT90_9AGAM|nr:hypothetical protein FIBSPDRAFT_944592 [Fibularhizoctonia sp. CBS 109695]